MAPTSIACFSSTISLYPIFHSRFCSSSQNQSKKKLLAAGVVACSPDLLKAAKLAVDDYVKDGMVVGLGCGPASSLAIHYMGSRVKEGGLKDIVGIPMSAKSASEAAKAGILMDEFKDNLQIDFAFHDADIIEEGSFAAVIGRRKTECGESMLLEKSIVKRAGALAFLVPETQYTGNIDGSIPVLINPGNWMQTAEEIDDLFLGDAEVWRRPTSGETGPLGGDFPLVTKEGHHILDVIFTSPVHNIAEVAKRLDQIDGVVDHGIVYGIPYNVIIAASDGIVVVDNYVNAESNE